MQNNGQSQILILFAHPALEKSRVNRHLIQAVKGGLVTIHDLYEAYPDFHIMSSLSRICSLHTCIVFHHPFYWYSSPAILKEWQVGTGYGFAGHERNSPAWQEVALRSRLEEASRLTAGRYNRFTIRELLAPFEQTARLCRMEYLPPFVVQGTHQLNIKLPNTLRTTTAIITARDNTVNWERLNQFNHLNQSLDQVIRTTGDTTPCITRLLFSGVCLPGGGAVGAFRQTTRTRFSAGLSGCRVVIGPLC